MISFRAAVVAVVIAFTVGIIGSLAVRPTGTTPMAQKGVFQTDSAVRIHWRVPKSTSRNMPVAGETPHFVKRSLAIVSNGAIDLQLIEPGEVVPVFAITDAVRDGKVEAGLTWLGYDQGKIPASALISAVPFGMEPVEYSAWWYAAGGRELAEEMYQAHGIHPILCGLTGPETAGWFRSPIESLDDFKGLKIRFAGLGGKVLERVGASVTMLPPGEIFQALEKGAIDATEYALPIVDQALGFDRIAKFNYFPGWHQPFTATHFIVNLDVWNETSEADQLLLETTCTAATLDLLARAEAAQGEVIANFKNTGVTAGRLPHDLLKQLQRVSQEVLNENAAGDAMFMKILNSQRQFLDSYRHWKHLAYLPRDF